MSAQHLADLGVIIVAAGRGERLGASHPKAFARLGHLTLLEHAVRTVTSLPHPGHLVIVAPEGSAEWVLEIAGSAEADTWQVSVVAGGRERHESVRKGLEAFGDSINTVLVHDAARPLTPTDVFERVLSRVLETGDAVIPVLPVTDTLKELASDRSVRATLDRSVIAAAQTPQAFPRELLETAHQTAQLHGETAPGHDLPTDDAELAQRSGALVQTVPGSPFAHKVTYPEDLFMLEGLLAGRNGEDSARG